MVAAMKLGHRRRLFKLARFLDALPRRRFDFARWVGKQWKGKPDLSCGTTACALGWACAMPEFQKLGAGMLPVRDYDYRVVGACLTWKGTNDEMRVSENLFGLTPEEHCRLFVPGAESAGYSGLPHDATPAQVAENIRIFLKDRKTKSKPKARSHGGVRESKGSRA